MLRPRLLVSIVSLIFLISFSAFAQKDEKPKNKKDAKQTETKEVQEQPRVEFVDATMNKEAKPANGSLFSDGAPGVSLIADEKARRVGDLVFVDVVEASTATVASSAKRGRDSGTLGGIGTLAGALPVPGAAVAGTVIGALGTRKFEGKGSTERTSSVKARIVARVVEVLPNGDLRIAAEKQVKINKETEKLILCGIVRPRDVAADNSIPTTYVGDLRVELNGKGVASADNSPGWLYRLFEKITPF